MVDRLSLLWPRSLTAEVLKPHLSETRVTDLGYNALARLPHEKNANANSAAMKDPIAVAKAEVHADFK